MKKLSASDFSYERKSAFKLGGQSYGGQRSIWDRFGPCVLSVNFCSGECPQISNSNVFNNKDLFSFPFQFDKSLLGVTGRALPVEKIYQREKTVSFLLPLK